MSTSAADQQLFQPSSEFSSKAKIQSMDDYQALYDHAKDDPEGFWGDLAKEELHWFKPFDAVLDWKLPYAKWFVGGQTNASYNCLDAHLGTERENKAAIIWEGEPGDTRTLTYKELHAEVCKFANALKGLGLKKGDVASIYMPMVPELAIAMLACARIGMIHSVIFGGFSSLAIADRNNDASAKAVITADGGWRRGSQLPLKVNVDEALDKSPTVEHCIVLRRCGNEVTMKEGRDHWWHDLVQNASTDCPAEPLDSETTLFILYTSGSTGKPKGIRHTTAGYNLFAKKTFQWVFDYRDEDIYWCTADCGWVTGHSYIVYGPLSAGATTVMYEGAPNHPDEGRFWDVIDKHKVNIFYTAPTAIRAFIKWGDHHVEKRDLSSLRLLGTVGEPINPSAWLWYHEKIGKQRCPIVDTWWQTETGGIMMSPLPGATATKPGSCTMPLPGVVPKIVDSDNNDLGANEQGMLVITQPWPGMLRGLWGDDERYVSTYWSTVPNCYLAGDNAMCDADGYYWIYGRLDDVLNVSGHRLSTTEIESAVVSHPNVAECAAVGRPHDLKGEAVAVFVTLATGEANDELRQELRQHVRTQIGAHAQPDDIRFTNA
ncbi:MAG: acetate--CoA ligase, partial [Planctomycetes bacterium]|nr:acetate--CoA ligase [Planctomycetota bacterium]